MLRISYRNKLRLKKLMKVLLILLASAFVIGFVLLIWLEPYVIYDRDGARLELKTNEAEAELQESIAPPAVITNPEIVYSQDPVAEKDILEMGGYYITTAMLQDPVAVLNELKSLTEPCAVMIELKSRFGNFYYSTHVSGAPTADVDTRAVDEIITYLDDNGFYTIGVVSAFSDYSYALENQSCGLPMSSGALWWDDYNCYWLDPANETVMTYLMETVRELSSLGFEEVAFSNFLFPDADSIVYSSELTRAEVIEKAAGDLTAMAQGSGTKISFVTEADDFPTAACTGRLYIPNVDGSKVERYVLSYGSSETIKELVFLASSRDTRFEGHAQLRPLLAE